MREKEHLPAIFVDHSNIRGSGFRLPETKGVLTEDKHGRSGWVIDVSVSEHAKHLGRATITDDAVGGEGGGEGEGRVLHHFRRYPRDGTKRPRPFTI